MNNLARKLDRRPIFQDTGAVVRSDGATYVLRSESGDHEARRAASCLLEPQPDDLVLFTGLPDGTFYILAVLERDDSEPACVALEGDLELRLPTGRLSVAAQEGVRLASGKDVSVVSAGVHVTADEGNVVLRRLSLLGGLVQAEVEKARLLAGALDSTLDRLTQRVKRAYRFIEERDQLRAGHIDHEAKRSMRLHGKDTLITADDLVKVDGDQIHLG